MRQNRQPDPNNPQRRIALLLDWDGTNYAGWQIQENATTIQGELSRALTRVCGERIIPTGCSRTDAGVHALGHVSHFETRCKIPVDKIPLALQAVLPADIGVRAAVSVPSDWNARYSPVGKQYSYYIHSGNFRRGLLNRFCYQEARPLDFVAMESVAKVITGHHDFRAFMAAGGQVKTTVRTVYSLEIQGRGALIRFVVRGDGFLYNMVRIIAGTLIYAGLGKLTPETVSEALRSGDRCLVGKTLPARGLFLDRVFYEPDPFGSSIWTGGEETHDQLLAFL